MPAEFKWITGWTEEVQAFLDLTDNVIVRTTGTMIVSGARKGLVCRDDKYSVPGSVTENGHAISN